MFQMLLSQTPSTTNFDSMRNPQQLALDHVEWEDRKTHWQRRCTKWPLEEVKDAHDAPKPLRRSLGAA